MRLSVLLFAAFLCAADCCCGADLRVLFLGDQGHHQPRVRFGQLEPVLRRRGIRIEYTDQVADLNAETLGDYDALLLYANIDRIGREQADALLDYVASGKGFVPVHCASYCFRNDDRIVALIGAQFLKHGTGTFRTEFTRPNHPVMRGFGGFESWDETYVHHKHNTQGRVVLATRVGPEGIEPWTWVRTHGRGRVFYTAWGHDHRTFGNPGFHNLIERGIRWAAGDDPQAAGPYLMDLPFQVPSMTKPSADAKPFEYMHVGPKIPNYSPGQAWGTQGKAITAMQKPLPPEESIKHISVPQGFRVELFASEPDLKGKPLCMNWDERGRLWVCESVDYPNELRPPGRGRDRIRICEDTDGDQRADKFTVFAEKLSIPTAITFANGGAIVQNGTETLFLKDVDGDDVADERKVLFTGWGLGDTHGGVSNFQYGPDNWIWAMQGYNNSTPRNGHIKGDQSFRQGFFRFRPDGSEIEFIRSTNNNTWGLGISEEGLIFGSTANGCPSVFMPMANRYYERVRTWKTSLVLNSIATSNEFLPITENIRQVDHHGGFTAAAGHALYTAGHYPPQYRNRVAFVCGPTGHLVAGFHLKPEGAGFKAVNRFNLFASRDEWTAPIMAEVGPDGSVWVLDWYNYIVQHNPTPRGFKTGRGNAYESDLRDKKHARIYRVVWSPQSRGRQSRLPRLGTVLDLRNADPDELVSALGHPTRLWRLHAQRLLVERGQPDIRLPLIAMVADRNVDDMHTNVGAVHAMWVMDGLELLHGKNADAECLKTVIEALQHASPAVRLNALRVLSKPPPHGEFSATRKQANDAVLSSELHEDPHVQVRLAAILAIADARSDPRAATALVGALRQHPDPIIRDAITSAADRNGLYFLTAAAKEAGPSDALLRVTRVVAEHLAKQATQSEFLASVLATAREAPTAYLDTLVTGLDQGWTAGKAGGLKPADEQHLETMIGRLSPGVRGRFVKLVTGWGSKKFAGYATRIARDLLKEVDRDDASTAQRIAAARQLIDFEPLSPQHVGGLLSRIDARMPSDIASGLVRAAATSRAPQTAEMIVDKTTELTPSAKRAAIGALLGRTDSIRVLLKALETGELQPGDLSLDQRRTLTSHPDQGIRSLARKVFTATGGLTNPDRQKVVTDFLATTEMSGEASAGKTILRKHCAKCHIHSGDGTKIGPDLTGMAVHSKQELLGHILDPSASVESNFRLYTVVTESGRTVSGMLASESRTTLELFDAEGKKQTILRDDIDDLVASKKSMMPEGFEKLMTRQEFADLLTFLTHRGRFVPIDISKIASAPSDRGMFVRRDADVERLIFADWKPKTFRNVPFMLIDPRNGTVPNAIVLHGPGTPLVRRMPKQVQFPVNGPVRAIHMLSGVGGWAFPFSREESVSMIVRVHYTDGMVENHELKNGIHFADYIRHVDVKGSELAFRLRGQQIRYLAVHPQRDKKVTRVELIKGPDGTAPVVMAVTIEGR